jgi:NAD(P)-dependent dehydrogenase (short-subunit alcohol dehydrogenase family)
MSAERWSPADMPSLLGSTAVVPGGNSGIGYHTALELARHGATVTLAVRTPEKGEAAAVRIRESAAEARVQVARLDLSSLDSVREFAEAWQGPLGLLVNNAGLMSPPRHQQTQDGFELQFGTNHLGHFALTGRLLPALLAAPSPRVVTVSSIAHRNGGPALLDGNPAERYSPSTTYGNSKLANLLFAFELQRRASRAGAALTSTAAHPGVSATNLFASEQGRLLPGRAPSRAAGAEGARAVGQGGSRADPVRRHRRRARLLHGSAGPAGEPRQGRPGEAQPAGPRRVAGGQALGAQRGPDRRALPVGNVNGLARFAPVPRLTA